MRRLGRAAAGLEHGREGAEEAVQRLLLRLCGERGSRAEGKGGEGDHLQGEGLRVGGRPRLLEQRARVLRRGVQHHARVRRGELARLRVGEDVGQTAQQHERRSLVCRDGRAGRQQCSQPRHQRRLGGGNRLARGVQQRQAQDVQHREELRRRPAERAGPSVSADEGGQARPHYPGAQPSRAELADQVCDGGGLSRAQSYFGLAALAQLCRELKQLGQHGVVLGGGEGGVGGGRGRGGRPRRRALRRRVGALHPGVNWGRTATARRHSRRRGTGFVGSARGEGVGVAGGRCPGGGGRGGPVRAGRGEGVHVAAGGGRSVAWRVFDQEVCHLRRGKGEGGSGIRPGGRSYQVHGVGEEVQQRSNCGRVGGQEGQGDGRGVGSPGPWFGIRYLSSTRSEIEWGGAGIRPRG
eukprot:scaffold5664_cov115-Isochrysis_galbana.AAC.6